MNLGEIEPFWKYKKVSEPLQLKFSSSGINLEEETGSHLRTLLEVPIPLQILSMGVSHLLEMLGLGEGECLGMTLRTSE